MSPKKRQRRKPRRATPWPTPATDRGATPRERTVSRTPVVIDDPPDRRVTALWVVLTLLWLLGTPLALVNLVLVVTNAQTAALSTPGGPPADVVTDIGNGLVWVLIMALAVPAASAVTALILRRTIAAIGFTTALVVSAVPLLVIMPPADLWQALATHFTS
ncbi:hypothetical protein KIK06_07065 [Nocardiopsis sp. EMB25]|uniref:hypothetical protein n=1 Tax=Nocardiopsis sp. EMB25 TaxID=2835867 RepID=UPI0022845413|nr:hypothetical protein [Nocardiopsis sp. EMB25]MCY9783651.1 hypothetical protein [Nocardiopsis sp. EMB25]